MCHCICVIVSSSHISTNIEHINGIYFFRIKKVNRGIVFINSANIIMILLFYCEERNMRLCMTRGGSFEVEKNDQGIKISILRILEPNKVLLCFPKHPSLVFRVADFEALYASFGIFFFFLLKS